METNEFIGHYESRIESMEDLINDYRYGIEIFEKANDWIETGSPAMVEAGKRAQKQLVESDEYDMSPYLIEVEMDMEAKENFIEQRRSK